MAEGGSRAVLVTGCSSGIGRATALRLAERGWPVYASARRLDSIADLEASGCRLVELDVTSEDSMRAAVESVERERGAVGALVNNAGYGELGALERVPLERAREQFETNVFGLLRLSQLVLPGMRAQGWGRIVNLSSVGGRLVFPGGGLYHASKFAVEALSHALRFEVAPFGVDVVVIAPGLIATRFGERAAVSLAGPTEDDGPYAAFDAAVAKLMAGVYGTWLARVGGGGPDAVARAIERALAARRPRARYRVTPGARMILATRYVLSDRAFDRFLAGAFPRPRP